MAVTGSEPSVCVDSLKVKPLKLVKRDSRWLDSRQLVAHHCTGVILGERR